jgi:hypothetical protein
VLFKLAVATARGGFVELHSQAGQQCGPIHDNDCCEFGHMKAAKRELSFNKRTSEPCLELGNGSICTV